MPSNPITEAGQGAKSDHIQVQKRPTKTFQQLNSTAVWHEGWRSCWKKTIVELKTKIRLGSLQSTSTVIIVYVEALHLDYKDIERYCLILS